jgi:hypothetical protein
MRAAFKDRLYWLLGGMFGSLCLIPLAPFNLTGLGGVYIWILWLIFPYGMAFRTSDLPFPVEIAIWLGPPTFYGLVLAATLQTRWHRGACFTLLALHTAGACCAAFKS